MRVCFLIPALAAAAWASEEPVRRVSTVVRADARSGRLVRSVVVAPRVVAPRVVGGDQWQAEQGEKGRPPAGAALKQLAEYAALKHNVDPLLVDSMIQVESGYNQYALSHKGAQGLMQLMPSTARRYGVSNAFDALSNIEAGVRHLKHLQQLYPSDLRLVLAAYNAGEGAVERARGIPRIPETEHYIALVGTKLGAATRAKKKNQPAHQVKPAPGQVPEHRPVEQFVDAEGRIHLRTR